jgi:AcrR family transcriptional regulator
VHPWRASDFSISAGSIVLRPLCQIYARFGSTQDNAAVVHYCNVCNDILMVSDEGLRARKQRETREAIHAAAVRRALAGGVDSATVADISAEANVSTRTFFNYFPCKEDAMLGFHEDLPTDQELADFVTAPRSLDELMSDVINLMTGVLWVSPAGGLNLERRRLLAAHPELVQRQHTRVVAVEQRIAQAVATWMRASGDFPDTSRIDAAAGMLVLLCSSVVRFAVRQSANSANSANSADSDLTRLIDASLSTFREVIHTLP